MVLGVNNFCYADSEGDITKTTAEFTITASNTATDVSFSVYLNLVPDAGETFESVNIGGITLVVEPSTNITYADNYEVNSSLKSGSQIDFDSDASIFSWGNTSGVDLATGATGSQGTHIVTLKYTFNKDNVTFDSTEVRLSISTEQFTGSSVTDTTPNDAKSVKSTPCNYTLKTPTTPACKEHKFTNYVYNEDATCTADGTETATCENEGCKEKDTKIKAGSALGHDMVEEEIITEPSCTEAGKKKMYCKRDGCDHTETVTIPATGHNWDAGVVTKEPTYLADGVKTYTCQTCKETKTEAIPKLTHDDKTAGVQYWGTREVHNGYEMYVDEEGRTSALIPGNEKVWLREESYDPAAGQNLAAWYMLDNASGEFEAGSRFRVQWLNNKDNPIEFLKHFNNIDQTIKDRIDSNRVWIFLVGVTKPDGTTEYKTLSQEIPLYIQMGTDWDYSDVKAMYISDSDDEEVYASYLNMEYPEGKGEFAKLSLKHFSPYAIYDYLTDEEKTVEKLASKQEERQSTSNSAVKTGDKSNSLVLVSSSILIITGLYLGLCMKKKRN